MITITQGEESRAAGRDYFETQNYYNYTLFTFKPLEIDNFIEFYVTKAKSTNYLFLIAFVISILVSPLIVSYGMLYFSQFGFGYANNYWLYFWTNLTILLLLAWIIIFFIFHKKSKKLKLQLFEDRIVFDNFEVKYNDIRSFVKLENFNFVKNYTFYIYRIDQIEPIIQFDIQSQFIKRYKALHYALAVEELLKIKISNSK